MGDQITLKEKSRASTHISSIAEETGGRLVPAWLAREKEALEGKVLAFPTRDQIDTPVDETMIVELYSK